jgi:predicted  nucleic acid-binding Zn ribbon protein
VIDEYIRSEYRRALKSLMIIMIVIITLGQTVLEIQLPNPVYTTNTHIKDLVQLYKNSVYFTDFFIAVHDQANSSNTTPEQKIAWNALKTAMWTSISNSKNICNIEKPMPMYQAQCEIDLSYIYEVCKLYIHH